MTTRSKQITKLAIRFLVTAGLLVWVFSQIDLGQFRRTITAAKWPYLIAVWALTAVFFLIRSVKLRFILKKQSCDVDVNTLFGATAVTSLYSMIIPGILSTGVKWYILTKKTGKGSNVLSSMIYNQFFTMVVMTAFGLAALMISNPFSPVARDSSLVARVTSHQSRAAESLPIVCGLLLIALLLFVLLLLNNRVGRSIIRVLKTLLNFRLPVVDGQSKIESLSRAKSRDRKSKIINLVGIRLKGQEILDQIAVFQTTGWRFHFAAALLTTVDTLVGGAATYLLAARMANIDAPVLVLVWLCAVIYIVGRLPITVANLGVREVTLVGFLAVYNVEKSAALLMSMILFSAQVAMAIVGALYQISWAIRGKKATSRRGETSQR